MQKVFFTVFIYAILGISTGYAQTVIVDDGFDDGDFTNNPTWTDSESKHIVNGSNLLQLNAPAATDEAVISTPSTAVYGQWEALVNLDFNPSGSNLSKFYILSDTQDMKGDVTGYYIQIGGTNDEVSLYRQDGSSSTKIIDGTDDLTDSDPVTVRVRATRDVNGNWELFADATGGTSFTSQGTVNDDTNLNSSFIGLFSDYTSTRSTLFQYDDIKVTKVNPPLRIQNITLQNSSTVDVQFNLDIDPTSVDPADFSLDNGVGNPNTTSLPSPDVVRLSYNSPLPSNQYTLTVNNVDDSDGNTISANTTSSFTVFGDFAPGDVIINEFVYDPAGSQSEYVELKNTSSKLLNLQNWQIGEGSDTVLVSTDEAILQPNGFAVISSDTSALFNVYGSRSYIQTGLGNLNNDDDVIIVLTNDGTQADSLQYSNTWGGTNVALERRSDTAPPIQANFGDSPNALGGTPGQTNEVADDTTPPDLDNLTITDNQTLDLDFSERLANGPATNTANYTLDNGITVNNAQQTADDSVRLSLSTPLQNGTEYQITISNQQDIFGNTAANIDTSFTFYVITPADSGDIFINEFTYDPPDGSTEYIELYNPTSESFDLNGWTINDNTGNLRIITSSQFIVPPDSFVVLAPDNTLLTDHPDIALVDMGSRFPGLNNGGDDIVLRDSTGVRLDSLRFTSAWGGTQIALERRTTDVAPIQANFGDAPNDFGTPGRQNQIENDTTPPDLSDLSVQDRQTLDLAFTEDLNSTRATDPNNYNLDNGITINNVQQTAPDSVRLALGSALQNGTEYQLTINNQQDIFGNTAGPIDTTFQFTADTTPPNLINIDIPDNQTLTLTFSENINNGPATTTDNYTLDNGIGISNAMQTATDNIQLSLDAPLQNGIQYQLTIRNQQDNVGNTAAEMDTSFTFFEATPADSGDIFINEFTYDPPEGSTEYIELYNPTSESFNLNGWTISDNRGDRRIITNARAIVPPDSFVVIAEDNTLLSDFPDINLVTMGSRFPSLNNSGDDIVLRDSSGVRLDSLRYTPAFGGSSVALERRTTDAPPIQANFGDAPNGFGTPGRQNQIGDDTTPPDLAAFSIINNQSLEFVFTEQVENQSATNLNNYSLSGGITINSATQTGGDTVRVGLSGPLQNDTQYTATIDGVDDLFGNTLTNRDTTFTYFEISPADSGDIFINEFTYDPPTGSTEYIELYNPTSESFDLSGWTINDNTGNRNIITNGQYIVPPDSFVVLVPDNTLLTDHPDIALVNMGSRFPSLNNSGDDIVLRDANGVLLDSLRYTNAYGGNNIAVERRTINAPPVQSNFGDAPNGFGTPGRQNQIGNDTTPPSLTGLDIPDNQTLTLAFSEGLAEGPASTPGNYTLNNGISITDAQQTASDSVRLSLSSALQNGTTYQLAINNQQDIFGNTAAQIDTSFTFFEVTPADSGDIFINEFTYDPPSGSTEYIELKNITSQSFDLNGWTINDNRGDRRIITNARAIVPPDSFIVIAEDNTLLSDYPDINIVTMGNRFPSLNNGGGDDIVLRNANAVRLDSLHYTTAWGGNNIAVERRTTDAPPIRANFGDAPNGFGTPGSANQIQPDNQPPVLLNDKTRVIDNTTIKLIFSETITSQTATDINNYSFSPSRNIQLISAVQDTVTLFLSQPLQSEQSYQLTVQNLKDVFGNTLVTTTQEITFVAFSAPQQGDIVINEFSPTSPEFVELFNTTTKNFDLSNWAIGDASNTATIDAGAQLRAGEYIVLTESASLANILDNGVFLSDLPSLDDDEDVIYVQTDNGVTVDSLSYTPAFGGSIDDLSAERIDPGGASNDASNFTTSTADDGSTPGAQNAVFMLDQTSPTIVFSRSFPNGDIEVRFSEFISLTPDLTFLLGDQTLSIDSFDPSNGNVIFLNTPSGTTAGSDLTVTAQNLSDVKGNTTASTQLAVAQPLTPGDVVINEILFDPLSDPDDNQPDQSEYIELRNIRDYAINLENITLHDAPDENGEVRTLTPVNTTSTYIPAQGTALIYAEDETPVFNQSKVAQFFNIQNTSSNSIIRIDRSSLSLASSGDAIFLADGNNATIDSVFYDETWHNPNLVDTDGIALERINPLGPSNNDVNWGSSTAETGGTPNQENTLFEEPQQNGQQDIGISFSSNPFSPDGDGTDENLLINYKLDQPDFLITVRIYDRYGRLVRELADGQQAGLQGSLIWDGLKDNGDHNRIGIYIVIFKAFDSANGNNKAFKKTVVLARRLN